MVTPELVREIHDVAVSDAGQTITSEGFIASSVDQDFGTPFGRDAMLCSLFRLDRFFQNPSTKDLLEPVKSSLRTLARYQGQTEDQKRDEQPGKILHELRRYDSPKNIERLASLKLAGWFINEEGLRYYGSVDATPLFVLIASQYYNLTKDQSFFGEIEPAVRKAIYWMKHYGDMKGDGYIRFSAGNRNALINQGWKDSTDSMQPIKEPIAS